MKKTLLLFAMICNIATVCKSQTAYTYRGYVTQQVVGSNLFIDFFIQKLSGADFVLGSSNFTLEVTPTWLDPTGVELELTENGPWDNDNDPSNYMSMRCDDRDSIVGIAIFQKHMNPISNQALVTAVPTKLARIKIPITDPSGYTNTKWYMNAAAVLRWPYTDVKSLGDFQNPDPYFPLCSAPNSPLLTFNGSSSVCLGMSTTITTSAAGDHIWYADGVAISGQTSNSIVAQPGVTYTARTSQYSCVSDLSEPITVGVLLPPSQPTVAVSQTILLTDATLGSLQWYLNGIPVQGANSGSYAPTESGVYTVSASNTCGSSVSEPVTFNLSSTSISDPLAAANFSVYPNPFQGQTSFHYTLLQTADVKLVVYDLTGRHIVTAVEATQRAADYSVAFSPASLGIAAGSYIVHFSVDGQSQSVKLVETR